MWYSDGTSEYEVKQEEILDAIGIALEECITYWCEELEYIAAIETNCVYFGNSNCSPYIYVWWNREDETEDKVPTFSLTFYDDNGEDEEIASINLSISDPDDIPESIIAELSGQIAQQDADVMSYIASDFGCIASDAVNELESKAWRTLMKSIPEKQMAA